MVGHTITEKVAATDTAASSPADWTFGEVPKSVVLDGTGYPINCVAPSERYDGGVRKNSVKFI